jgi:hypothetical protein
MGEGGVSGEGSEREGGTEKEKGMVWNEADGGISITYSKCVKVVQNRRTIYLFSKGGWIV